jgi:glycosyltransferase involved in cell wall biosynthesis
MKASANASASADGLVGGVSAALITLNAQAHLRECLASLAWCDEIVVIDGGSSDGTTAICAEFGVRLVQAADWPGFGKQKNRAVEQCAGEWIFSIDADEVCSEALRAQLLAFIAAPGEAAACEMPRRSNFCGHWIRHGGWWPDRVTRLFRRGRARFSDDMVHERLLVDGPMARLSEPLLHYTYDTLEQALAKMDRYSTLGAQQAYARGRRATPLSALARGAWAFFRTYLLRLGLLDGGAGLMLASYNAHGTYYRYLKLWLLCRDRPIQ